MSADVLTKTNRAEPASREATPIRSIASGLVGDGVRLARRAVRQSRYTAEDAIDEVEHRIKQQPFQAVGLVFAAGLLMGCFTSWITLHRR